MFAASECDVAIEITFLSTPTFDLAVSGRFERLVDRVLVPFCESDVM